MTGDWTFFQKCSGTRPLLSLEGSERASQTQGKQRAGAPRVALGQRLGPLVGG